VNRPSGLRLTHRTGRIFNSRSPRRCIVLAAPTSRRHYSAANQSSPSPRRAARAVGDTWRKELGAAEVSRRVRPGHRRRPVLNMVVAATWDSSAFHASSRCQYRSIRRQIPSRSHNLCRVSSTRAAGRCFSVQMCKLTALNDWQASRWSNFAMSPTMTTSRGRGGVR